MPSIRDFYSKEAETAWHCIGEDILFDYPLIIRALDEQAPFLNAREADFYTDRQPRLLNIIHQTIDRPQQEKEALMVAVIFAITAEMNLSKARGYGAHLDKIIGELEQPRSFYPPANIARITCAIAIAGFEDSAAAIAKGAPTGLEEETEDGIADQLAAAEEEDRRLFKNLNAPKMKQLYIEAKEKMLIEMGFMPRPPQGSRPPSAGTPRL